MSLTQWIKARMSGVPDGRRFESVEEVERTIGMNSVNGQVWHLVDAMDVPSEGIWYYLKDVYFDAGIMYAIIQSDGKLYRADIRVADDNTVTLGDLVPVTELFVPVVSRSQEQEEPFQKIKIIRTANGRHRWLSISNTAILNRVGELDSRALFDSFVEHALSTGEYPYRTFNHEGEVLRTGQADFIARDGYTYITSGLYDEDSPLAAVERAAFAANPDQWGESIGYIPTSDPEIIRVGDDNLAIPVYTQGVNLEISTCLERNAASWFTAPLTVSRSISTEVKRMKQSTRTAISDLLADSGLGENESAVLLAHFEKSVDSVNERATSDGVVSRTATEDGKTGLGDAVDAIVARAGVKTAVDHTEDDAGETAVADSASSGEMVIDDSVIDAVVSRMLESDKFAAILRSGEGNVLERIASDIDALNTRFDEFEEVANANFGTVSGDLAAVQASVAAEVARAADMPAAPARTVIYRPSVDRANPAADVNSGEPAGGLSKIPHYSGTR